MKISVTFSVFSLIEHVFLLPAFTAAVADEDEISMPCMMRGKGCDKTTSIRVDDLKTGEQDVVTASDSKSESDDIKDIHDVFLIDKLTNGLFPGEEPDFQKHPFIDTVEASCSEEIKQCRDESDDYTPSFYNIMICLEELHSKGAVGGGCKTSVFSVNGKNPNEDLFHIAAEGSYWSHPIYFGYLKAPLIYSNPGQSPLTNVWFGFVPCKNQPAPKGMLFQHNGGPSAGLGYFGPLDFHEFIFDNYDFVMVDQRGMGLSYIYTFLGEQNWGIMDMAHFSKIFERGHLYATTWEAPDHIEGRAGPCYDVLQKYGNIFEPQDFTDEDAMYEYLMKKQQATVECSKKFDRQDSETGTKYNILQYYGTQALSHDIEWLRWAFGFPKVSILGLSYGTRVAADYASRFPQNVQKVAVSGVMAPDPNSLSYAKKAADNTREIFAFLQSKCNEVGEECTSNPFPKDKVNAKYYFSGDVNEALTELFNRSAPGSTFYEDECGGKNGPVPFKYITRHLALRLTSMVYAKADFLDEAWPRAMLEIPAAVFAMVQNPCDLKRILVFNRDVNSEMSVFTLIPALDMTGHASAKQTAQFVSSHAKDIYFSPSLEMFRVITVGAFGWPQFSTPIAFSNPDIEVAIGQALYDQRTGMNMAQDFARNFPKSRMAVAPISGHCVGASHGAEAYDYMMHFLLFNEKFPNGLMTDMPPKSMPFGEVAKNFTSLCHETSLTHCLTRTEVSEENEFKDTFTLEMNENVFV